MAEAYSPFDPILTDNYRWTGLHGCSPALAIASLARQQPQLVVVVCEDNQTADKLAQQLQFFSGENYPIFQFPDWETLPYDIFSPLPDIVSQRLTLLYQLETLKKGILILPITTLMQRVSPKSYLKTHSFLLNKGDTFDMDITRQQLHQLGYSEVSEVLSHSEYSIRGSIIDIYPMGSELPYRVDLFDDKIDSIRLFAPETQRSIKQIEAIHILPAKEFPFDEQAIAHFQHNYQQYFKNKTQSFIYQEVKLGNLPSGIDYYFPLFFEQCQTQTLVDYLPKPCVVVQFSDTQTSAQTFYQQIQYRYKQRYHDMERPILEPWLLYLSPSNLQQQLQEREQLSQISIQIKASKKFHHYQTKTLPDLVLQAKQSNPLKALQKFIQKFSGRILLTAESTGRREILLELLQAHELHPKIYPNWQAFLHDDCSLGLTIAPIEQGMLIEQPAFALMTEFQIYGEHASQSRRQSKVADPDTLIRSFTELKIGDPVVHQEHGIGRFQGLQTLDMDQQAKEFLLIAYANDDKLYVPIANLDQISRYSGSSKEKAPLHKLGSEQWQKTKRKALAKIHDVATELLEIQAKRLSVKGFKHHVEEKDYQTFSASFAFEHTPDQASTIQSVLDDMQSPHPMDRVVCGDVGFGKTEVALHASFIAVQNHQQVAILVPTTLLAEQHLQNFQDRFADWPMKVESLSRFRTAKQQQKILDQLTAGTLDIVIGTHKLLQPSIKFKNLGLVIIDEEHRFGVRHKERLKQLRANVDLLTLTATPIPRTLNMAMAGLRDLSIIATPPPNRHAIQTFISEWNDTTIQEACLREIKRGGQIYLLHNDISTIEHRAETLGKLLPQAKIRIAHGQMSEKQLEGIMLDFYHQRFHILVCTTIIESGIDVPTANTIIVERADKLGLAQLHQLRGRVGRSHHRAYAYFITPKLNTLSKEAQQRIQVLAESKELGSGFVLATHDLEIRGAGELLGQEQSGEIHAIGFNLYCELLEQTIQSLKAGHLVSHANTTTKGVEINLQLPALLPEDYVIDIHSRLILYKRIANAKTHQALNQIKLEIIDRFGQLPPSAKNLFIITQLKHQAFAMGIQKIEAGLTSGRLVFKPQVSINPEKLVILIQTQAQHYRLEGQDQLKFYYDMSNPEIRLKQVQQLLNQLQ